MIMNTEDLIKMLNLSEESFDKVMTDEYCEVYENGDVTISVVPNLKITKGLLNDFIIAEGDKWFVVDNLPFELEEKIDMLGYFPCVSNGECFTGYEKMELANS